jgi:predicted helicase
VGISTSRDSLCIDFSFGEMLDKVKEFAALPSEVARERFDLGPDVTEWSIKLAQNDLIESGIQETRVYPIFYRPFDTRYTYYTGNSRGFHSRPRPESMRHLLSGTNLAFCSNRQVNNQFRHVFASRHIADGNAVSLATRERTYEFPLYLSGTGIQMSLEAENLISNLDSEFLRAFTSKLYRTSNVALGLTPHVTPEDIFHYIYAIFHSPTYRARYAEFLKIDFPRVPLTSSLELFRGLAALGGELVALHLMESPALAQHITTWAGPAAPTVEKVSYADGAVWLDKARTAGFRGVPENVWNFHIGGYQVCEKWLKDRKGRVLSAGDIEHYQRVVVALAETIRITGAIDALIEAHGGWPLR